MKFFTLTFVLLVAIAAVALAEPEPEPAKASRYRAAQIIEDDVKETDDQNEDVYDQADNDEAVASDSSKKGDASSGRLFMKKFLLFKNMFGQKQTQPVIPIIITGANNDATTAFSPTTTTITSDGTIPTVVGTISISPDDQVGGEPEGEPEGVGQRIQFYGRDSNDENDKETAEEAALVDEQTLAAALAAGAEEYVVTDQEIKGTSDAKANRAPARINLRRRGSKNGQVVSVRVPSKYRGYFQNGQRVILNNNNKRNRPVKRRVIKRRTNRRRINKNKNKRRRIVAA